MKVKIYREKAKASKIPRFLVLSIETEPEEALFIADNIGRLCGKAEVWCYFYSSFTGQDLERHYDLYAEIEKDELWELVDEVSEIIIEYGKKLELEEVENERKIVERGAETGLPGCS